MKKSKPFPVLLYAFLAGIVWSSFASVPFLWDDKGVVVDNYAVHSLTNAVYFFSKDYFSLFREFSYRPIVTLSHMVDFSVAGNLPYLHHAAGFALHFINGILLFYLLRMCIPAAGFLCGAASLVFLVNSVHLETIAIASYRDDMLMAFFFLAALLFSLQYKKTGRFLPLMFSIGAVLLSLFSKETALVFLPAVILIDMLVGGDGRDARRWRYYGLIFFVTIVYCWIRFKVMRNPEAALAVTPFSSSVLLAVRPVCTVLAALNAFFLRGANGGFDYNTMHAVVLSSIGGCAVCMGAVVLMRANRRVPAMRLALILFLLPLVPVCGLYPLENFFAHRYMYFPAMGLSVLVPCLISGTGLPRRMQVCLLGGVITLFSIGTLIGQRDYWSEENFARAMLRSNPQSHKAYNYLGTISQDAGRIDDARAFYTKAIEIEPSYYESVYNLASVLITQGDYASAAPLCNRLVQLNSFRSDGYRITGDMLLAQGTITEAEQNYCAALERNPQDIDALNNLGTIYESAGKLDDAAALYRKVLSVAPRYAPAWSNLGNICVKLNDYRFAVQCYLNSLQSDANNGTAWYNLGNAYMREKKWNNAEQSYLQALRANPESSEPLYNLAVAYVAQGNRPAALDALRAYLKDNPADVTAQQYFSILTQQSEN